MAGTGTLTVTPDTGTGAVTINTLPPSGQATPSNSLPMTLDTTVEATLGTSTTAGITVQGGAGMLPVVVAGSVAPGAAPTANPVGVSGVDAGGLKRAFLTDTAGVQQVTTTPAGLGAMQSVPAATTTGTALGTAPVGAKGARIYLPSGASVTYTIASTAPTAAPTATFTVSASATGPNWDEDLAGGQAIYVTAVAGSPLFRWY